MSTIKTNAVQIGQSLTATNNFTFYQPAVPDGTVRIGNGNAGAATDKVTIDSSGNVSPGVTNTQTLGIVGDVWSNVYATTFTGTTGTFSGNLSGVNSTFTGEVQATSYNGGQLAGMRNKIINGNITVNQRAVTAGAITGTVAYTADRWASFATVTPSGTLTMGQQTYTVGGGSSNNLLRISRTSGTYVGSLVAAQAFETVNSYGLAGQTVCISFRARAGSAYLGASLPKVFIKTGTGTDQSTTLMISNSWTGAASTDVTLTGTLGTLFSTFYGTATIPALTTQVGVQIVSVYTAGTGTANDYLDITDVQLEIGSVATPYEQRHYGAELGLCRRYYEEKNLGWIQYAALANTTIGQFCFFDEKRVVPAITVKTVEETNNATTITISGIYTSAVRVWNNRVNIVGETFYNSIYRINAELL